MSIEVIIHDGVSDLFTVVFDNNLVSVISQNIKSRNRYAATVEPTVVGVDFVMPIETFLPLAQSMAL